MKKTISINLLLILILLFILFTVLGTISHEFGFWLREVFNLLLSVGSEIISPDGSYFSGDEKNISILLNLWEGTISIALGTFGIIFSTIIIFQILPKKFRLTFITSGIIGVFLGFSLWMYFLDPILMP